MDREKLKFPLIIALLFLTVSLPITVAVVYFTIQGGPITVEPTSGTLEYSLSSEGPWTATLTVTSLGTFYADLTVTVAQPITADIVWTLRYVTDQTIIDTVTDSDVALSGTMNFVQTFQAPQVTATDTIEVYVEILK